MFLSFLQSHFHSGDVSLEAFVHAVCFPIQLYLCSSSSSDTEVLGDTTKNQKGLQLFSPASLLHTTINLYEVLFEMEYLKLISEPEEKEIFSLCST